jgi:hypothetical protein
VIVQAKFRVVGVHREPSYRQKDVGRERREYHLQQLNHGEHLPSGPWWGTQNGRTTVVAMNEPLYGALELGDVVYMALSTAPFGGEGDE